MCGICVEYVDFRECTESVWNAYRVEGVGNLYSTRGMCTIYGMHMEGLRNLYNAWRMCGISRIHGMCVDFVEFVFVLG